MNIRLYAYFPHKAKFDFFQERYDCPVIFLLSGGRMQYGLDTQPSLPLEAGEWLFCPAGTSVYRKVIQPISLHMLKVSQTPFPSDHPLKQRMTPRMSEDLARLAPFGFCREPLPEEANHWGIDILFEIARFLRAEFPPDDRTVLRRLLAEMEQAPERPYSNQSLCRRMCCCEARLIQLFREETGQTPQQHLQSLRLQFCRTLLVQTDDPIQSVAAKGGFSDPLYFSRLFSRCYGQPPSQFRKQNRI